MRSGPDYIQFYPTLRCNRSCGFCFNRAVPSQPDMTLKNFRMLLGVLTRVGVRTIDIIGGEPTLHHDIVSFVRESLASGLSVNISSNGTDLSVLEAIARLGRRVTIGISVNDRETLDHARGFIREHQPVIKSLFSRDIDLDRIGDILVLKPKKFHLIYRDTLHREELRDAVPFHEFTAAIEQRFPSEQVGMVFCSGFVSDTEDCPDLGRVRCPAGTTKLGVLPDGSVYPCNLFFGKREFRLGNLLSDSFKDIWEHRTLSFFRSPVKNSCAQKSCRLHARCHGGCPAHGLFLANDLAGTDPRCSAI